MVEPITPELALVDPELRRAGIAALDAEHFVFAVRAVRPLGMVAPRDLPASRSLPRLAAQLVLMLGLLAAGVLVANVAARNSSERPVLLTATTTPSSTRPVQLPSSTLAGTGAVERRVLALIVQSPTQRLPAALVDPRTGLPLSNLQAVCHPAPHGFLCLVRPVLHKAREGMYVRYGPNGFTWYPYRSG